MITVVAVGAMIVGAMTVPITLAVSTVMMAVHRFGVAVPGVGWRPWPFVLVLI